MLESVAGAASFVAERWRLLTTWTYLELAYLAAAAWLPVVVFEAGLGSPSRLVIMHLPYQPSSSTVATVIAIVTATSAATWEWYLCAGAVRAVAFVVITSFEVAVAIAAAIVFVIVPSLSTTVSF